MSFTLVRIPLASHHVLACQYNSTIYITVPSVAELFGAAPGAVKALLGNVQLPEAFAGLENSPPSKQVFITLEQFEAITSTLAKQGNVTARQILKAIAGV